MALIVFVAQYVQGNVTLLLIGVMTGYLATAIIGVLKFFSAEEDVKAYVVWGLGCFTRTSGTQLIIFSLLMCVILPLIMPATLITGSTLTLVCALLSRLPGFEGALPVNSVTALVGAPIIATVLFKRK